MTTDEDPDPDDEIDDNDGWPPPRPTTRDEQIIQSVHGAYHALNQRLAVVTRVHGSEPSEALVLIDIDRNGWSTSIEVRRRLGLHRSTMSSIVDRLEHDGLVTRRQSDIDGRRYEIVLTPAGDLRAGIVRSAVRDVEMELRGYTSPFERRGARAVFEASVAINHRDGEPFD